MQFISLLVVRSGEHYIISPLSLTAQLLFQAGQLGGAPLLLSAGGWGNYTTLSLANKFRELKRLKTCIYIAHARKLNLYPRKTMPRFLEPIASFLHEPGHSFQYSILPIYHAAYPLLLILLMI
jgi:hypothetical protein